MLFIKFSFFMNGTGAENQPLTRGKGDRAIITVHYIKPAILNFYPIAVLQLMHYLCTFKINTIL